MHTDYLICPLSVSSSPENEITFACLCVRVSVSVCLFVKGEPIIRF